MMPSKSRLEALKRQHVGSHLQKFRHKEKNAYLRYQFSQTTNPLSSSVHNDGFNTLSNVEQTSHVLFVPQAANFEAPKSGLAEADTGSTISSKISSSLTTAASLDLGQPLPSFISTAKQILEKKKKQPQSNLLPSMSSISPMFSQDQASLTNGLMRNLVSHSFSESQRVQDEEKAQYYGNIQGHFTNLNRDMNTTSHNSAFHRLPPTSNTYQNSLDFELLRIIHQRSAEANIQNGYPFTLE